MPKNLRAWPQADFRRLFGTSSFSASIVSKSFCSKTSFQSA